MPETPPPGLNPIAELRRLEPRLPELTTLQFLELRDAAEAGLARAPLTAADVSSLAAATEQACRRLATAPRTAMLGGHGPRQCAR